MLGAGPAGRASQKPPPSTPCCELEQNSGAVKGLVLADFKEEAAYKLVPFAPPTPQHPQYTHLSQGLGSWPPLAFHLLWLSVCLRLSEHGSLAQAVPHALDKSNPLLGQRVICKECSLRMGPCICSDWILGTQGHEFCCPYGHQGAEILKSGLTCKTQDV